MQVIEDFYKVYHSSRFVDNDLVIRLNQPLAEEDIETLGNEFNEILRPDQRIRASAALEKEADQPDLILLPRLIVPFNHKSYGLLEAFIRRINAF